MKKGFTIVETMLVLSISGLLTVALLVGWSININRQRYDDAVNTFKSDIQDVFNEVENPTNSNENNTCDRTSGRKILEINNHPEADPGRGNSNCIIMGKMIIFSEYDNFGQDVNTFTTFNLIGIDGNYSESANSIEAIRASQMTVDLSVSKEYQIEWGARSRMVTDNRDNIFKWRSESGEEEEDISYLGDVPHTLNAIMIVKSPLDGSVLTFGAKFNSNIDNRASYTAYDLTEHLQFITSSMLLDSSDKAFNICVRNPSSESNIGGTAVYGRNKMIRIGQNASSVEIMPLDTYNCGNGGNWSDVTINGEAL